MLQDANSIAAAQKVEGSFQRLSGDPAMSPPARYAPARTGARTHTRTSPWWD
jgi:hypothetical protein